MDSPSVSNHDYNTRNKEDFTWENYLDQCGMFPCRDALLFGHVRFMDQTVLERLCPPGIVILVHGVDNGKPRPARVEVCVISECLVEYLDGSFEREWIKSDDIETDPNVLRMHMQILKDLHNKGSPIVSVNDICYYDEVLHCKLYELIEAGQYFELQDPSNPCIVSLAKVVCSFGGIIYYTVCSSTCEMNDPARPPEFDVIHITDPRCHAIGWTDIMGDVHKDFTEASLGPARENAVPELIFERVALKEHGLSVGTIVEVADGDVGTALFPGHVTEVHDRYYFTVETSNSRRKHLSMLCYRGCDSVYHVGFSASLRLDLFPPRTMGISGREMVPGDQWTWEDYSESFNLKEQKLLMETDWGREMSSRTKVPTMQYVEVFMVMRRTMCTALIVRSAKGLLWLIPASEASAHQQSGLSPWLVSINSVDIFPVGFAAQHGIPLVPVHVVNPFHELPKSAHGDRFGLNRRYRSEPGPVFRKINVQSRGRPEKRWHFLPETWLKGDLWLLPLYIRRSCVVGPMLDADAWASLADSYPAGPLPLIIESFVKDVIWCAHIAGCRNEVISILDIANEDVPSIVVKWRWRTEHVLVRILAPETVYQFGMWLRMVLRCLGCCPCLITPSPDEDCDFGCEFHIDSMFAMRRAQKTIPMEYGPYTMESQSSETVQTVNLTETNTKRRREHAKDGVKRRRSRLSNGVAKKEKGGDKEKNKGIEPQMSQCSSTAPNSQSPSESEGAAILSHLPCHSLSDSLCSEPGVMHTITMESPVLTGNQAYGVTPKLPVPQPPKQQHRPRMLSPRPMGSAGPSLMNNPKQADNSWLDPWNEKSSSCDRSLKEFSPSQLRAYLRANLDTDVAELVDRLHTFMPNVLFKELVEMPEPNLITSLKAEKCSSKVARLWRFLQSLRGRYTT